MQRSAQRRLSFASLGLAAALALLPAGARAQGGPPLITDDPDTPGPGYWEINLSTFLEKSRRERRIEAPRLDLNYGVGRRIQLKLEVPWLVVAPAGEPSQTGAGDVVAGMKWRFLGLEGQRLAWSVYPQLEWNAVHSSVTKGLVEEGRQLLLPTEITVEVGHFEINGELGRSFVSHGAGEWVYGVSTEAGLSRRLELLGELHGESRRGAPVELIVNLGARQKLSRQLVLMLAAGKAVHGDSEERPRLLLYAGLQLNLSGFYDFARREERRLR